MNGVITQHHTSAFTCQCAESAFSSFFAEKSLLLLPHIFDVFSWILFHLINLLALTEFAFHFQQTSVGTCTYCEQDSLFLLPTLQALALLHLSAGASLNLFSFLFHQLFSFLHFSYSSCLPHFQQCS